MKDEELRDIEDWVAGRMSQEAGPCPEDASLLAFGRGELAGEAAASIMQHVDLCGECQAVLLRHRKLSRIMSEVSAIPQQELPALPGSLRRRVFSLIAGAESDSSGVAWFRRRVSLPAWALVPVAALLLTAVVPMWLYVHRHREMRARLAELDRPFSDVEVLALFGGVRSEERLPEVRATSRLVVLQLGTLADLQNLDEFRAVVEDQSGRVLWKLEPLRPSHGTGVFLVAIPGASLTKGRNKAILIGCKGGIELLHEEYEFVVIQ